MDGEILTPQNEQTVQVSSPVSQGDIPREKGGLLKTLALWKVGIIEFFLVGIVLAVLFGVLNYFNILPISNLWPDYFGWLPHQREVPTGTSQQSTLTPTTAPTAPLDTARQSLASYLPTILASSILPQSLSDIAIGQDKDDKEKLNASWNIKEGGISWAVFPYFLGSQKINSLDIFFEKIQIAPPSVGIAKATISQIFSIKPKEEWKCKSLTPQHKQYCESFWEEKDVKKGLGLLIITVPLSRGRLIVSYCEHTKESDKYSWKSCKEEFAQTGVL